jgi:protein transport protein SEC31
MQRVGARAPQNYKQHVADVEKRLNILFDHLNNQQVVEADTIDEIKEVAQQIQSRQHDAATALITQIITAKTNQGSDWMVSVFPSVFFTNI